MGITGIGMTDGSQNNVYQRIGAVHESGFYERMVKEYHGKTEDEAKKNNDSGEAEKNALTREEMVQLISDRIGEIYEKVKNNDTEPSFQIGNQSFTIKEWDTLIKQFDTVQEEIREQMKEEQAKRQKETTTKVSVKTAASVTSKDSTDVAKAAGIIGAGGEVASNGVEIEDGDNSVMESLVMESTICTYPSSNEEEPDKKYITWYTSEGIFCREAGQTEGYYWTIFFADSSQYDKVMGFLGRIKSDSDYRFAADENFWQDFLNGKADENDFPVETE